MKKNKKRFSGFRALAAGAAAVVLLGAAAVSVLAETAYTLPIAVAKDADGNILKATSAIVINSINEEDAYVYTSSDLYDSDASTYLVYTSYDDDYDYGYYLDYSCELDELGLIEWVAEGAYDDVGVIYASYPYQEEVVTAYYYNSSGELESTSVTIEGLSTDSYGNYVLEVDSLPDASVYPIFLADSSGYCVGIAGSSDTDMVFAPLVDEEYFYSSSGFSLPILPVAVIIVIVVVVILVLKKKKSGNNPDQGHSGSAGGGSGGSDPWANNGGSGGSDPWANNGGSGGSDLWANNGGSGGSGSWANNGGSGGSDPWANQAGSGGSDPWAKNGSSGGSDPWASGGQDIQFEVPPPKKDVSGNFCVVCVGGAMNGRIYPIGDHEITFGRDPSCTVCFPADTKGVSRMHCKLLWRNGTLMLMDCGSSYGTYAAQGKLQPQTPVPIKEGEIFYIAEKKNCFRIQMLSR